MILSSCDVSYSDGKVFITACPYLKIFFLSLTGVVSDDYKLINVHVVIRHGDRSPISRLPGLQKEDMSCLLDVSQYSHIPKVANYPHVIAAASEERSKDNSFKRF